MEHQRVIQQGKGNRIQSVAHEGRRLVRVGDYTYIGNWITFHDFLAHYIQIIISREWFENESEPHPLRDWWISTKQQTAATDFSKDTVASTYATGAVLLYLRLAYDLFTIANNVELQNVLIRRLKNKEQFSGALFETHVAAIMIRAGFILEFEDETDGSVTHCEFTARKDTPNVSYSVEAKFRKNGTNIGHQLYRALKKKANHTRIVFIGLNLPVDQEMKPPEDPAISELFEELESAEHRLTIDSEPAPQAYIFLMNTDHMRNLDGIDYSEYHLFFGFKIYDLYDLKADQPLSVMSRARKKHKYIYDIAQSINDHRQIPSTFDGQIPEFAFGRGQDRLVIGKQYLVPDSENREVVGTLVEAIVIESEKKAYCTYELEPGKKIHVTNELSEQELSAYARHPKTFFGIKKDVGKKTKTPIEMYEFMLETYSKSSREKLLSFLFEAPDYDSLLAKSQIELAEIYCQRSVEAVFAKRRK